MLPTAKSFIAAGASFLTVRASARLAGKTNLKQLQLRQLAAYTKAASRTDFGRHHEMAANMPYEEFRERITVRTHDGLTTYIDRMRTGEADVLWPGPCNLFALTAGTTTGERRSLPVTEAMLAHLRRTGRDILLHFTSRVGHAGIFRGRHLTSGGTTTLEPVQGFRKHLAFSGDIGDIAALDLPGWIEAHYYEPGLKIARIVDEMDKLRAIADRTIGRDITVMAGTPQWLIETASVVLKKAREGNPDALQLRKVWPNLECLIHGGMPIGPFSEELRALAGQGVALHEVYAGAEGVYAVQDGPTPVAGLRLLAGHGIFYEFIPLREYDKSPFDELGHKAVPVWAVQSGVDYVMVITTPAGLCRFIPGDIVRFTDTSAPRLIFIGRLKFSLNAFGESLSEKEVTDVLSTVCQRHHWHVVNFHVAPLFADRKRGQHEWWLELRPISVDTPTGPVIAAELDAELQRINDDYAERRCGSRFEAPVVKLVMPGVFNHWFKQANRHPLYSRIPRCAPDRKIAEQLALIARFNDGA